MAHHLQHVCQHADEKEQLEERYRQFCIKEKDLEIARIRQLALDYD